MNIQLPQSFIKHRKRSHHWEQQQHLAPIPYKQDTKPKPITNTEPHKKKHGPDGRDKGLAWESRHLVLSSHCVSFSSLTLWQTKKNYIYSLCEIGMKNTVPTLYFVPSFWPYWWMDLKGPADCLVRRGKGWWESGISRRQSWLFINKMVQSPVSRMPQESDMSQASFFACSLRPPPSQHCTGPFLPAFSKSHATRAAVAVSGVASLLLYMLLWCFCHFSPPHRPVINSIPCPCNYFHLHSSGFWVDLQTACILDGSSYCSYCL